MPSTAITPQRTGQEPAGPRPVRAPRGTQRSCKGWAQEAALRMLMNNLDPDVAERPDELIVYGGTGRAARSWAAFDAIVDARAHRELAARAALGDVAALPRARAEGSHDVWPDDRGLMDLHRLAGHR